MKYSPFHLRIAVATQKVNTKVFKQNKSVDKVFIKNYTVFKRNTRGKSQKKAGERMHSNKNDDWIKEIDRKIIHVLWTIFISMLTALLTTIALTMLKG